ncbi:uracil-DNA glycosylase, partial [Francisella tularensis subsp. holarctica]|nr:uracil-DNA glycosylase [Francisella tularensis subsp. holarctica]
RPLISESTQPSPLAALRGFRGRNHFDECNKYLIEKKDQKIDRNLLC